MNTPRLIYYNDGHHFHGKRIDPPASTHLLQWPVDEVAGTGVEALVLGLGFGDVFFHQTKVGRVLGQGHTEFKAFINWRVRRMVEEAEKQGTDQVREVVERGRELGVPVFTSLKLQGAHNPTQDRCGILKLERGLDVCIGGRDGDRDQWAYDFALEEVRSYKIALLREVLENYQPEGIELDFVFTPTRYFKPGQEEKHIPTMTGFVADVRKMAEEVGKAQGRHVPIMARVHHTREGNLALSLDVETWLKDRSVDYVVGQIAGSCMEPFTPDVEWLPEAARAAGAAAYLRPPRRVYDDRTTYPSIEMFRALSQTVVQQGFAGLYFGYFPWPFGLQEYQVLREAAFPEITRRHEKLYFLQPREGTDESTTSTPHRQLPVPLEEGKTATVTVPIADDVDGARRDGEMRAPVLTIRFADFCVDDEFEIRFNGVNMPVEDAEISHYRALPLGQNLPGPVLAPGAITAHWLRYRLPTSLVRHGDNTVEVALNKKSEVATFERSINGVEILLRYGDFERPIGFGLDRTNPQQ